MKGELQDNWQYVSNWFPFSHTLTLIPTFLLHTLIKGETFSITLLYLSMSVSFARKCVQIVFSELLCPNNLTIQGPANSYLTVV